MQINPVWNYGTYDPAPVSAGAQPDWYMLFLEGSLRLTPGQLEVVLGNFTVPLNVLIPGLVIPLLLLGPLAVYPFLEAYATGDKREHHLLDRPRNAPFRTAYGMSILSAFFVLVLAGSNDLLATHFHLSLNDITWTLRFAFFLVPPIVFAVTRRVCLALQRKDRELVLHGHESGRIVRFASGEYVEVHTPLDEDERWIRVQHEPIRPVQIAPAEDSRGVRRKTYKSDQRRQRISRLFFETRVEPVTPAEYAAAQEHLAVTAGNGDGERQQIAAGTEPERISHS